MLWYKYVLRKDLYYNLLGWKRKNVSYQHFITYSRQLEQLVRHRKPTTAVFEMLTSGSNDFCITLVNQICCTKLTMLAESRVPAGWYSMEILESCGGLGDHHSKDPEAEQTRTTRTPAFWGYPRRLDPKSKEDKVKVTNLKNSPKFLNFWILKRALHATHLLKLLDKMCKYEMDPMSIVEDTELTRFCPQTDRRTRWYQYTPFQLRWSGGYKYK